MSRPTIGELAVSGKYLVTVAKLPEAKKGDLCQVMCPNDYCEPSEGFMIKNLANEDFYQIVNELTEGERELGEEFEFTIIEWNDFDKYFRIADVNEVHTLKQRISHDTDKEVDIPEAEEPHWIMGMCAFVCLLAGIATMVVSLLGEISVVGIFCGLILIFIYVAGATASKGWKSIGSLSLGKQLLAWLPVIAGSLVAVCVVAFAWSAKHQPSKRK